MAAGHIGREAGDVIEGDDPVTPGEPYDIANGRGGGGERGGGGIDECAQDAGGEGLSGAGTGLAG